MKTCFFAYPSKPAHVAFLVRTAIDIINEENKDVYIQDWAQMPNSGKHIVKEICNEIDDCDVFIADITAVNPNVLFELGYAIATNKRIWLTRSSDLDNEFYDILGVLKTIGYAEYKNAYDINEAFWKQKPFDNLDNTLFNRKIKSQRTILHDPKLFYLKSFENSQEASSLSRLLLNSEFPLSIDDPSETGSRSLEWYIEQLTGASGVIAHFLPESEDKRNGKYALICGMAFGLGKKLLMLASFPHKPAFDYTDLMFIYSDTSKRDDHIREWLKAVKPIHTGLKNRFLKYERHQQKLQAQLTLQSIDLGDYEAEGEQTQLENYFIPTASYFEALRTKQFIIFSGRKGSGKTANFYRIAAHLRSLKTSSNHVCVIKPVYYELEGVYQIYNMKLMPHGKDHLVETLWKYLIYSELALDLYKSLHSKAEHSASEQELVQFVAKTDFIKEDFSVRLDHAVRNIYEAQVDEIISEKERSDHFSNILHDKVISHLRILLGRVLEDTDNVIILIDNLDKAWQKDENIEILARLLFGLLNVVERISMEFHRGNDRQRPVSLSLIVFIRSDILTIVKNYAPEKDKLKTTLIDWKDEQLLYRLIEERFRNTLGGFESSNEIWEAFFTRNVNGIPTKTYIIEHVLPRPRDMIYFVKQALFHAINHEHTRIESNDIIQAASDYSNHAYDTLVIETSSQFSQIEDFLRKFMNSRAIVTKDQLLEFIESLSLSVDELDKIIDLLLDAQFLGLEVSENHFVFLYDDRKEDRLEQAERISKKTGIQRYKINKPFHAHFEIETGY